MNTFHLILMPLFGGTRTAYQTGFLAIQNLELLSEWLKITYPVQLISIHRKGLTHLHCNIYVILGPGALPVMQGEYKFDARDHPEGILIPSWHTFILNPVFLKP
jgi:hypothetical protein